MSANESWSKRSIALALSILMVTSVLAPIGVSADVTEGERALEEFADVADGVGDERVSDDQPNQADPADVDDAVRDAEDTVEAIVRVEEFDPPDASPLSTDEVVEELRAHAVESQQPVIEYAAETDGMEVRNQFWITNAVLVEFDTERIDVDELAAQPGVSGVHENFDVEHVDPVDDEAAGVEDVADADDVGATEYDTTYGLDQIGAPDVWDEFDTRGGGASIAVLDTGVDPDHPDIDIAPENFQEFDSEGEKVDSDPYDSAEHGTHVSGTVVGGDASGEYIGVAPEAELMHGLVLPGGSGDFAQIVGGMEWAVDEGADVISMSLGAEGYWPELVEPVVNAREAGTVVVSSSGNDGPGSSGSPGNVYDAVAVGATDEGENVASFSSGETVDTDAAWGDDAPDEWPSEYVVPDVSAPGVGVLSAVPGEEWTELSGTSMSAPHVSGTIGLLIGASGGTVDADEIETVLEETAVHPEDGDQDSRYGHGVVDASAAAEAVAIDAGLTGTVADNETGDGIPDASVELDDGYATTTDDDGEYTLRAGPGEHVATADAFGYETTDVDVEVPDDETFVEQSFELDPEFAFELRDGQRDEIVSGDTVVVEVDAGNVEEVTVEYAGDYPEDRATLYVDGDPAAFGETVEFDEPHTGTVTIEVATEEGYDGEIALEHELAGLGESTTVETGPTFVWAEPIEVGLVAHEDDPYAEEFADSVVDRVSALWAPTVLSSAEATDRLDEFDVLLVHSLGSDLSDFDDARDLMAAANEQRMGMIVLDQQGTGADAVTRFSESYGYPAVVDYPGALIATHPDWYADVDDPDHELWDGVQFDNITTAPPDFVRTSDDVVDFTTVMWDGFDGDVEALAGQALFGSGPGVGTDDPRGNTLLAGFGYSNVVGQDEYSENMYEMLDNAFERAVEADEYPVLLTDETPDRTDPGETLDAAFDVENLTQVKTEVTDESTVDEEELALSHNGVETAFGEWTEYDDLSDDAFAVAVETPADETGIVELRHVFEVDVDGSTEEVVVTTRATSLYESPIEVPADAETIGEAIDMAVPNEEIVVAEGTYEEQVVVPFDQDMYNLTIRGEEGATPTIVAPADAAEDGEATIEIQQAHTTLENLHVEGHQLADDVDEYDDDPGDLFWGIVSGVTAGEFDTDHTTIRDVSIDGVDVGIQFGGLLAGSDSNHGVIDGAEVTDTHIGIVAGTPPTEVFITDAADTTIKNSYVADTDMGILGDARHSDDVVIHNNTVENASIYALGQDGNNWAEITDNTVRDSAVGIFNFGGQIADYSGNHIADTEVGISLDGTSFTGYQRILIEDNEIGADVGVHLGDQDWLNHEAPVWIHYNDLSDSEVAIESDRASDHFAPVDARLNWFGDRGTAETTVEHDPDASEVIYDPYLVERPEAVDREAPRAFATGLDLEANGTYTVGIPGPVAGDVGDVFGEFEGSVYGFDAEYQEWELLRSHDDLETLEALYVEPDEDVHAQLSFYHGDDAYPIPGEAEISEGWNFVPASQAGEIEDVYGTGTADPTLGLGVFDRPESGLAGESGELTGPYVFGADDDEPVLSPFEGTFVYSESDGYLPGQLYHNPSLEELYDLLDVPDPIDEAVLGTDDALEDVATNATPEDVDPTDEDDVRVEIERAATAAIDATEPRTEYEIREAMAAASEAAHQTAFALGVSEEVVDDVLVDVQTRLVGIDAREEPEAFADAVGPAFVDEREALGFDLAEAELEEDTDASTEAIERSAAAQDAEYHVAFVDAVDPAWNAGERMVEELESYDVLDDDFHVEPIHATEFFDDLDASLDTYDVVVVNNLGTDDENVDGAAIEAFLEAAERPDLGVVYLDQNDQGPPTAIHELADERGDPAEAHGYLDFGSDEAYVEITEDHAVFDGLGTAGDEVQVLDPWTVEFGWFEGYDGDVVGEAGSDGDGVVGPGVGVDEVRNEALLSSLAFSGFIVEWDISEDGYHLLANAIESVEPFDPVMVESHPELRIDPGEEVQTDLRISGMEELTVDLADESTVSEDELDLYVGGEPAEFGETRSYDPAVSEESYPVTVATDEETVGSVALEITVDSELLDEPAVLLPRETAVYEPPLTVPGTVETVQEAVDLAPDDGRTVYLGDETFEEQVTIATEDLTVATDGDTDPTIVAPENADGTTVAIDAPDVTIDGVAVEGTDGVHGVTVEHVANATLTDVAVEDAESGVVATGTDVVVEDAAIEGVSTGVDLEAAEATITDVTVTGETGVSLALLDPANVDVQYNDLSATDVAVESHLDDRFDARLNYLGHGTENTAIEGDVAYQPFLTAPPSAVDRDRAIDIGVEVIVEAGEPTAVGVPGHTTQSITDVFDDDFEGVVYGFDAEDQQWEQLRSNYDLEALKPLLVVGETDGHAVLEFRADGIPVPGTTELEEGWNFVSPSYYGDADGAFHAGSSDLGVAVAPYDGPEQQLGPGGDLEGSYVFGSGDAPVVSAFEGYFVHADEGTVPSYLHSDVTLENLYALLGLDADDHADGTDDESAADDSQPAVTGDRVAPSAPGLAASG